MTVTVTVNDEPTVETRSTTAEARTEFERLAGAVDDALARGRAARRR